MSEVETISAKFSISEFGKNCPTTANELIKWINEQGLVEVKLPAQRGYNSGSDEPSVDNRIYPWFREDEEGRYIGTFLYSEKYAGWVRPGAIGETRTIIKSEETVEDDIKKKFYENGWALADGNSAVGIIDLTSNTGFFIGIAPDYEVYTLGYTG